MRHLRSFRGHRLAVYCMAINRAGTLAITGCDDWLVKVMRGGYWHALSRVHPRGFYKVTDIGSYSPLCNLLHSSKVVYS